MSAQTNPATLPNRPVVHLHEFAQAAGVSERTIVRGVQAGRIPAGRKVGRRWVWGRTVVTAFLGLAEEPANVIARGE